MNARATLRIVSLVPSETYNVAKLNALGCLVGRTRYCVQPTQAAAVPVVGGTKDVDVDRVIALCPDIVLANKEENQQDEIKKLIAAGLNVRLAFAKTVKQGWEEFEDLAVLLQTPASDTIVRGRSFMNQSPPHEGKRCFVPIWFNPWMTANGDTYIGDVLRWLGMRNVFANAPSEKEGSDVRYPSVTIDQIVEKQPEVVLLPDEPYRFQSKHVSFFEGLDIPAARAKKVFCVDGKDLCWHGAWALEGLNRLRRLLEGE